MDLSNLVAIDTETSHWDKKSPIFAVTEVGFATVDGVTSGVMDPGEHILNAMQPDVIGLTGLTPDHIRKKDDGGSALRALIHLLSFGSPKVAVAHNWPFDREALNRECERRDIKFDFGKIQFIDTYRVTKELYDVGMWTDGGSKLPDMKLATCFYGIVPKQLWNQLPHGSPHKAGYDALMSMMIAKSFIAMGTTVEDLVDVSMNKVFVPRVCPMGKNDKGKPWPEVDGGFLRWMADKKVWDTDEGLELAVLGELERRGMI